MVALVVAPRLRVRTWRHITPLAAVALSRGFAVAAAERTQLHIIFGAAGIPHPEKADRGGEDAYFADDAHGAFGVADGVGGSASATVDPGLFSREMLRRCHEALRSSGDERPPLTHALQAAAAQKLTLGGSSTLLVGQLDPSSHLLRIVNLGDSGAMLLRPASRRFRSGKAAQTVLWPRLLLRSHEQTHYFNCPYQVAADDALHAASRVDELFATVGDGDVLVAATDGVLDNLFDEHIQSIVARALPSLRATQPADVQAAVDDLAQRIATEANAIGMRQDDESVHTPFEAAAAQEGYTFAGGKLDDVAVVCGIVRSGKPPPPRVMHNFQAPGGK